MTFSPVAFNGGMTNFLIVPVSPLFSFAHGALRGPEVHNRANSGTCAPSAARPGAPDVPAPERQGRSFTTALNAAPTPPVSVRRWVCAEPAAARRCELLTEGTLGSRLQTPRRPGAPTQPGALGPGGHRAAAAARCTHLFEAEGHGEDTDPYYAVHYVHDQPPVGGGGRGHGAGSGARGPECEAPGPPRGKGREALTGTGGCLEEAASREGGEGRQPADPARPRGHLMALSPAPSLPLTASVSPRSDAEGPSGAN